VVRICRCQRWDRGSSPRSRIYFPSERSLPL